MIWLTSSWNKNRLSKLFYFFLVILLITGAISLQFQLTRFTKSILSGFFNTFKNDIDASISYDSLKISFLEGFYINNVKLHTNDKLVELSVSKIKLNLNLIRFMINRKSVKGILLLDEVNVHFKGIKGFDTANKMLDTITGIMAKFPDNEVLKKIEITKMEIESDFDDNSAKLAFHFLNAIKENDKWQINTSFIAYGEFNNKKIGLNHIELPVLLSGKVSHDFSEANFQVGVSIDSDYIKTQKLEFIIDLKNQNLNIRKYGNLPIDYEFNLNISERKIEGKILFENFKPDSFIQIKNSTPTITRFLGEKYNGTLNVISDGTINGSNLVLSSFGTTYITELKDNFRYTVNATLNAGQIFLERIHLSSKKGYMSANGSYNPAEKALELNVELDYQPVDLPVVLTSNISISGKDNEYFIFSEGFETGLFSIGPYVISGEKTEDNISFSIKTSLLSDNSSTHYQMKENENPEQNIKIEGILDLKNPSLLFDAEFGPILVSSFKIDRIFPEIKNIPTFIYISSVSGSVSFASDFKNISYHGKNLVITSGAGKSAYAIFSIRGNNNSFSIYEFFLTSGEHAINGQADFFYGPDASEIIIDASLDGVKHRIQGIFAGNVIYLSGDYGLALIAGYESGSIVGNFSVLGFPFQLNEFSLIADINMNINFSSLYEWSANFRNCSIYSGIEAFPRVNFSGRANQSNVNINSLEIIDKHSSLSGMADLEYTFSDELKMDISLQLSSKKSETYDFQGNLENNEINALLVCKNALLSRLTSGRLTGVGNCTAVFSGTLGKPEIAFDLELVNALFEERSISAIFKGNYKNGYLELKDGYLSSQNLLLDEINFYTSFDNGFSSITLNSNLLMGNLRFSSFIELEGKLYNLYQSFSKKSEFSQDLEISGMFRRFTDGNKSYGDIPVFFEKKSNNISIKAGSLNEIVISYDSGKDLFISSANSMPISFTAEGIFTNELINLDIGNINADLGFLMNFPEIEVINFPKGRFSGDLRITGNFADPDFSGSLEFFETFMEVPGFVDDMIGPINAIATIEGKKVIVADDEINVGKNGLVSASFEAVVTGWTLESFNVHVKSIKNTLVNGKTDIIPWLNVKGQCGLDLNIDSDISGLKVIGSIMLPEAEVVIFPKSDSNQYSTKKKDKLIDIKTYMGKNVEIFFPSRQVPILSGQTDPSSFIRYKSDSISDSFNLTGNVTLRGGELFYLQRNFFIKNAVLVFDENETRFDPRVTLNAELKMRNVEGPVSVILSADNASLSNLSPKIESRPALSMAEIAYLLGQDILSTRQDGSLDFVDVMINASEFVPQLDFVRLFERNAKEVLGLDLFYIKTQVLQRWLVDASNLDNSSDQKNSIEDYFDQTALYAGKYIGNDIYAEGSLFLQKNPLEQESSLSIQSEIGMEWTTPYFSFYWNFRPENPESLFLADQSFSFYWKFDL